jgi:hypothetical protein
MRRLALTGALAAAALAALAPAAPARTTRLVAYSELDDRPQGYFRRGDDVRVLARNFIPPPLCRARVRFTLVDRGGRDFTLGRFRPRFGIDLGIISRVVGEVPAAAAFGRARLRSRQRCNVGTASGLDNDLVIVDPSRPPPRVLSAAATGTETGSRSTLTFRIDREALVSVAVDFELVPGVFREVDVLRRHFYKSAGTYTLRWRARVGGLVPPGPYRFRITSQAPAAAVGAPGFAPFMVRPRPPQDRRPGTEQGVAAGLRAAASAG